uniref:WRKY transcription factor 55 n=1 Tax=Erigeron canadensis TaxID=72917 RepID=UPI001CB8B57E|nr:WRKY transcription factor 55 [Erigeron canadensis]
MEEIVSLIFHGCKIVKDLEQTLPNIANQPHVLINSCDEISRVFGNVREQLSMAVHEYGHHEPQPTMEVAAAGGLVPEWMRSSQAMDMVISHHQQHGGLESQEMGGGNVEAVASTDVVPSTLQRTRRRKNEVDRRTFRIPAPRMGNTEVPPEDGYTWRKYGQKEILGSRFPRGYYRCTHQKLYNCPAKKQVQRVDNDPFTFEVTYRGDHTCIMSSTAPSMPPPPPPPPPPEAMTTQTPPSQLPSTDSHSLPQWLSIDLKQSSVGDLYSITTHHTVQTYKNQTDIGSGEGPSSPARYVDYPGMTDLVDTMFNSGSSSNNSMELIFSPNEEKKEKTN